LFNQKLENKLDFAAMKVDYKQNSDCVRFWVFDVPSSVEILGDAQIGSLNFSTVVEALGLVKGSLVAKYQRDVKVTSAGSALNVFSNRLGFNKPFGDPIPLDRAHLQHWGFYMPDDTLNEVSEAVLEVLESDTPEARLAELREEVETRTSEQEAAQKRVAELQAAGGLQEAKEWEARAQRHARRLDVLSTQLRLLTPSGRLALAGEQPSGSSDALVAASAATLNERFAAAEDCEEKVKARVEELGQKSLIRWIYGSAPDELICYVKRKMPLQQRILYILSKNATPSPVEFATLFMEISNSERCCKIGKAAFEACKTAHKEHNRRFSFKALPESEQQQYKNICCSACDCAVCGRPIIGDKVHCSDACAAKACECCGGPMEHTELSREVRDMDRARELYAVKGVLQAKGVVQPVSYLEKQQKLHQECRGFVSCFAACGECQDTHNAWAQQHADWKQFGRMPAAFWEAKEARLAALEQMAETKTIVEVKRKCAAGCADEQRAEKRRRV
jgi:hypothetical protein